MCRFFFILFLVISSCSENENYGEINFFDVTSLNTMDPILCSDVENSDGLLKIDLQDEEIYSLFKNALSESSNGNRIPDVRYKVKLSNDTICLDYAGNYITTKGRYGKIKFMKKFEHYFEENRDKGLYVTQPW